MGQGLGAGVWKKRHPGSLWKLGKADGRVAVCSLQSSRRLGDADEDPRLHTHTAVQHRSTKAASQAFDPHLHPSTLVSLLSFLLVDFNHASNQHSPFCPHLTPLVSVWLESQYQRSCHGFSSQSFGCDACVP